MSREADITWLKSCIETREKKLKELRDELRTLERVIPTIENAPKRDKKELEKIEKGE